MQGSIPRRPKRSWLSRLRHRGLFRDQRGITTLETTVLFVVITVGALGALYRFGPALASIFGDEYAGSDGKFQGKSTDNSAHSSSALGGSGSSGASNSSQSGSSGGGFWNTAKAFGRSMGDEVAGAVVGYVPFGSLTNPAPPFGNKQRFGEGMMVGAGAAAFTEATAMVGDGALTLGSGGGAAAVTVPAAAAILTAATGTAINWAAGSKLAQSSGIVSSSGGSGSASGGGGSSSGGGGDGPQSPKKKKLPRYDGPKPKYEENLAHVPGKGLRRSNPKTPLPKDAAEVYKNAVPDAPVDARNWFGKSKDGSIYRYSSSTNEGTAHFSGSSTQEPGIRNLNSYARERLAGK